jgi:hypothetical protein
MKKQEFTIPYYEDMTRISNSNIGWFIKHGPTYLHNMLTGKGIDIETSYLSTGTLIHMAILQPNEYSKTYQVRNITKPKSNQQKIFVDELNNSKEIIHDKALINAYNLAYTTSTKQTDKVVLDKAKKLEIELKDFINSLNDSKKSISFATKTLIDKIFTNISEHKLASYLLNDKNFEEAHNEFQINWDLPIKTLDYTLPCKSLLDRVLFNLSKKEITLIDLKTTSNINDFGHSMVTYDYCRQLSYYWMAIFWYLKNIRKLDINIDEWKFNTYIIAISSLYGTIRVFDITEKQLDNRIAIINNATTAIAWHQKYNKWDHTKEYYDGDGSELLKLDYGNNNKDDTTDS